MKKLLLLALWIIAITELRAQMWSVDDCMRYAVQNSPTALRQQLNEDDARKNLTEAKLGFIPGISASSGLNTNFGRSIDPETNTYNNVSNLSNSYSVSGGIDLFNGLNTINGYKIAKAGRIREEHESVRIDNMISVETMRAYYVAVFAHGALRIGRETLAENRKIHEKGKREFEVGLKNISELAQLESRVSQEEYNVISLEGEYKKSILVLKEKMFFSLDKSLEIDTINTGATMVQSERENSSTVIAMAFNYLPEVKIWDADVRKAELEYSSSKATLLPRLNLNGGISTSYSRVLSGGESSYKAPSFSQQFKDRMGEYVGVSLSVPIFGSLSRQMSVQRKKNALKRSNIDRQKSSMELERSIAEAVIDLESLEKQCHQSVVNVKANNLSYRTTEAKYNEGLASVIDLQTTQTSSSKACIEQLKAILNFAMQRRIVDYYKGKPLIKN